MTADRIRVGAAQLWRRSALGAAAAVALVEALHASARVHQFLFAGEERMALVTKFEGQFLGLGGSGLELVAT